MKPLKLLACLVTLQFISALTLKAAEPNAFRDWTDDKGRQISARLIGMPDAASIKIERQDGRVFTIPVKTFSETDQAYIKSYYASQKGQSAAPDESPSESGSAPMLADASSSTWELLNTSGNQPASTYQNTGLDTIILVINERFNAKGMKTTKGESLQIRTEPSDLADQVKVTGDLPRMNMAAFIKQIATINKLAVKTDANGMIVLVDTTPAAKIKSSPGSFFGVPIAPK
jgi:hypothetical protein